MADSTADAADRPVTVLEFARRKQAGEPIVMITAYDALFASLVDAAGPLCDGQVLVLHDMLGLDEHADPRPGRPYADLGERARAAVGRYADEVRRGGYPGPERSPEG